MLSTYFKRQTTLSEFYGCPAGPYLDEFTDWLSNQRFQQETIRRRIQGVVQFVEWTESLNIKLENLTPTVMNTYSQFLAKRGQLSYPCGYRSVRYLGAIFF